MNLDNQISLYQTADGKIQLEVALERDTVWLRQEQMAELFGRERSVITKHLRNIFVEGELEEKSNVQNLHIAGSDKPVKKRHRPRSTDSAGGGIRPQTERHADSTDHAYARFADMMQIVPALMALKETL